MRTIFSGHLEEPAAVQAFLQLQAIAAEKRVCLLCYEADPGCCHRQVLTSRLIERMPLRVNDLVVPTA